MYVVVARPGVAGAVLVKNGVKKIRQRFGVLEFSQYLHALLVLNPLLLELGQSLGAEPFELRQQDRPGAFQGRFHH